MKASEFLKHYIANIIFTQWIDDKTAITRFTCDNWPRYYQFKAIYENRRKIIRVLEDEDIPDELVKKAVRIKK